RLVTLEESPRVIDLTGADISNAAHAYGVNGVLVDVELPSDPATEWVDVLIGVDTFENSCRLAIEVGDDPKILKRMLSNFEDPIPTSYFLRHRPYLKEGEAVLAVTVSVDTIDARLERVEAFAG